MSRRHREVRTRTGPPGSTVNEGPVEGSLSLEAVMVLPILALLVVALLQVAALVTDTLLLHEAARAGARTAATTTGSEPVARAARQAAPELEGMQVRVEPVVRRDGDLARVEVRLTRQIGPVRHPLRAVAFGRVEPAVGNLRRDALPGSAPP